MNFKTTSYHAGCSIIKTLNDSGYVAYFAGGWVRDFLMKVPSDDIDIATDASVEIVQKIFPKTIPVGVQFGIVIVVLEGFHFEVATFRKDQGYQDGRRPLGIEMATPEEDALRRDFTINGMFYNPLKEKLYDFVGGQADLRRGVVRAIGNPHERFLEDRLRMIRAVRYASRFHFSIDPETMRAIEMHAEHLFPAVAIERVWQEFQKMAAFSHFDIALIGLHRLHLLPAIFPKLKGQPIEEMQSRLRHLPYLPKDTPLIIKLLELFPDASLQDKMALCDYLKLSNDDRGFVSFFHQLHHIFIDEKKRLEDFDLTKIYADMRSLLSLEIIAAKMPKDKSKLFIDSHQKKIADLENAIFRMRSNRTIVTSKRLMEEGISPGKTMGQLLLESERIAVNEKIEEPDRLIKILKETPLWP